MALIYALLRGGSAGRAREVQFTIESNSGELPNIISSAFTGCPTSAKGFEGWHIFRCGSSLGDRISSEGDTQ